MIFAGGSVRHPAEVRGLDRGLDLEREAVDRAGERVDVERHGRGQHGGVFLELVRLEHVVVPVLHAHPHILIEQRKFAVFLDDPVGAVARMVVRAGEIGERVAGLGVRDGRGLALEQVDIPVVVEGVVFAVPFVNGSRRFRQ